VPGVLILNPRSGSDSPSADELADEARSRGIQVHLFRDGEDLEEVARTAEADALGMAGGDGSLAPVATVAMERNLPFVCVPFGTATTSRGISASTATTRSLRWPPSRARSAGSTSAASTGGCS
jgi:diacylglycerol kinase family enzyme